MFEHSGIEISTILYIILSFISLIPLLIFYVSSKRIKDKGIFITTIAFFLFFMKGVLISFKFFFPQFEDEIWLIITALFDLTIIILISTSLFIRKSRNNNNNIEYETK